VIAYLHTEAFATMIGTDHIPRIGEKIRISPEPGVPDERDGLFQVIDVLYEVPCNPGKQRIDIYAKRVCDAPTKLGTAPISIDTIPLRLQFSRSFARAPSRAKSISSQRAALLALDIGSVRRQNVHIPARIPSEPEGAEIGQNVPTASHP
jgi:hypothetical protein